jgi:tetratricopeptide (TPR) repeat protein
MLHGQHTLNLADDARDGAHVRSLIPPQGSALLITSRTRFTLPGMTAIHLGQLAEAEATELLRRICPSLSVAQAQIIALACSCLPLALRDSGGILYNTPAMPIADYLARLMDERQRLAYLRDPDDAELDVAASLALSYAQLDAATQQIFRQIGVMVADFALPMAQAVVAAPEGVDVEATLYLLLRRNLVMYDVARARWRQHDLLRDLARSYLEASGEWDATWWRYARAAVEITQATQAQYRAGGNDALPALARFDTERPHIDEARHWVSAHAGLPQADALLLADALATQYICYLRYDMRERLSQLEAALAAAQRLGDQWQIGVLLTELGRAYSDLGVPHQVRHYAQRALAIARTVGDQQSEWMALACLGIAYALQGAFRQAIPFLEQALMIAREQREPAAIVRLLALLGRVYGQVGRAADALCCLEQAHSANHLHGNPYNQCLLLASLGRVYVALRDAEQAIAALEHALAQARAIQLRTGEAEILSVLGQAHAVSGDDAGAVRAFEAALAVLQEASDRWAAAECQWHFGLSLAHQGQCERALGLLRAALSYEQEIGHVQAAEHAALLARLEAGEALPEDFLYSTRYDQCTLSTARE